jgi:hypothetical protein
MSAPFTFVRAASNHRWIVDGASSAYRRLMMLVTRVNWMSGVTTAWRELGPYAAVALLLPGGTLIVVSLWILQHRVWFFTHVRRGLAIVLALLAAVVLSGSTLLPGLTSATG